MVGGVPSARHRVVEKEPERRAQQEIFPGISRASVRWAWNALIAILALLVAYFSYEVFTQSIVDPTDRTARGVTSPIQLDILNGCGVSGAAAKVTVFLRRRGFDVVEVRNYKSFDIQETLVIDRVGNLALARRVAQALDVKQRNIIQEINLDYFVDVSVVVGKDYTRLPLRAE